jgi:hypothetical protein
MASRDLGTIQIKGRVVVEWDNGARQEVGEVSTYVKVVLPDDEPVAITKSWSQSDEPPH